MVTAERLTRMTWLLDAVSKTMSENRLQDVEDRILEALEEMGAYGQLPHTTMGYLESMEHEKDLVVRRLIYKYVSVDDLRQIVNRERVEMKVYNPHLINTVPWQTMRRINPHVYSQVDRIYEIADPEQPDRPILLGAFVNPNNQMVVDRIYFI